MIRRLLSTFVDFQALSTPKECTLNSMNFGSKTSPLFSAELESLSWLNDYAIGFPINGECVTVIEEPRRFYETILERCGTAKKRIVLASLYLGTGQLEQDLVHGLLENMKRTPNLTVDVLLDFSRGTRGEVNSKTILAPLLNQNRFCLSLYHTPNLRGLTKQLMPARWNELIGLQHMKVYLFDDSVIISGANLSQDYFTNRQDRYVMIENKHVSDFFCGLVKAVQEFSLRVSKENSDSFEPHDNWESKQLPFEGDQESFVQAARTKMLGFYHRAREVQKNLEMKPEMDTFVFPLIEMGQLGIHHDSVVTRKIFENSLQGSQIKLASGYFNLTDDLIKVVIDECPADCSVLMAHPTANGFMGARGPAGGIPDAYTLLACQFQDNFRARNQENRIHLYEFQKPNWTYHAKGLWYYLPDQNFPTMALIGSSNFGQRSVNRDLEAQVCLVTTNKNLQSRLRQEWENLFRIGSQAEQDITTRIIPTWVRAVVSQFRNFF